MMRKERILIRCARNSRVLCIDFDGPIHRYSKGYADGTIYDEPTEGVFDALLALIKADFRVFIFTARQPFEEVRSWLMKNSEDPRIQQLEITDKKLPAIAYIDDRGIRFTRWTDILNYFI